MKLFKPHANCKFTKKSQSHLVELLNALYPEYLKFARFRRKFRELTLISEEIGRRRFLRMGSAGYIYEKEQQLTRHMYMIHPYSAFHHYWKIFALLEFTFSFILRLVCISYWNEKFFTLEYQIPSLVCDIFQTSDILLKLLVGYVDKSTQSVIMEFRKVIHRNFHSFSFYIGLVVSLPIDFTMYLCSLLLGNIPYFLTFSIFFKILKIFSLSQYVVAISKNCNWPELRLYLCVFAFISLHICTWLTSLLFAGDHYSDISEGYDSQDHLFYGYLECFYTVCSIFFGQTAFTTHKLYDTSIKSNIVWFFLVNLISFIQVFFVSVFIQLIGLTKTSKLVYRELTQEIQKFLAQENLPRHIHKKVLKFLKFRYNGTYFDENAILETLSPPLRREVKYFLCFDLVKHPESIFSSLPEELASELCLHMKLKIYIAGDTIFRAGQKSDSVYFIYSGSVVMYSSKGRELRHWYCGQHFGVAAFMHSHLYLMTAVALETSEIYSLRHKDFLLVAKHHPDVLANVVTAATIRIDYMLKEFGLEPLM